MDSYAELPLECRAASRRYDVLRAAVETHPGSKLARSLGLPPHRAGPASDFEHVLVGVFSDRTQWEVVNPGVTSHEKAASPGKVVPNTGKVGTEERSAVCVFAMRDVRAKFTETIQRCFRGVGTTGPNHFVQPRPCLKTVSTALCIHLMSS